jgi:hypothetical protein
MIANLIQQLPDWVELNAQEIADLLNAKIIEKIDDQLYTYAGLIDKLGQEAGFAFRATMRTLAAASNPAALPDELFEPLNFAHDRLTVGGLDFSRQDVQSLIDALIVIPQFASLVPVLKAIGRYEISMMANAGLSEATVEMVEDGLLQIRKKQLEDTATNRLQAYREALSVWDGSGEEPVL